MRMHLPRRGLLKLVADVRTDTYIMNAKRSKNFYRETDVHENAVCGMRPMSRRTDTVTLNALGSATHDRKSQNGAPGGS